MSAHPSRATSLLVAGLVAATAMTACRQTQTDAAAATPTRPTQDAAVLEPSPAPAAAQTAVAAPNTAVRISLSRLSRIARPAGAAPVIDLRIDGFEASGAPAQLGGHIRVELEAPGAFPARQTYDFPLATLEQAARHFDATLSQYILRIDPNWSISPPTGANLALSVTLTDPSGATFTTSGSLKW